MKLYLGFILFLLCSCVDEQPVIDFSDQYADDYSLIYKVEQLNSAPVSYTPSLSDENKITNLLYLFFDEKDICRGFTVLRHLDISGNSGLMPIRYPAGMELKDKVYTGKVFANLESYTNSDISTWASLYVGKELTSFYNIDSSLGSVKTGQEGERLIFFSGEFVVDNGSNSILELKRRSCAIDFSLEDLPVDVSVDSVGFSATPIAINLFNEKASFMPMNKSQFVKIDKGSTIRLYTLPNLSKFNAIQLKLIGERMLYKDNGIHNSKNEMVIVKDKWEQSFSLYGDNQSNIIHSNRLFRMGVFPSVRRPDSLICQIDNQPADKRSGRTFSLGGFGLLSVSQTTIKLNFSSSYPHHDWLGEAILNGSVSEEIFLTFSNNALDFTIEKDSADWYSVSRNDVHGSVIVTANPNFTITPEGEIESFTREGYFKLKLLGTGAVIPFKVMQNQAPFRPSAVTLEAGLTIADRHALAKSNLYCTATASYQAEYEDITPWKYYYGDLNALGKFFSLGTYGTKPAHLHFSDYYPKPLQPNPKPSDFNIGAICPPGYGLPSLTDLSAKLYPCLRRHRMECIDRAGSLVNISIYYVTNGTDQIAFFPLQGTLGPQQPGMYWDDTCEIFATFVPENPRAVELSWGACAASGIKLSGSSSSRFKFMDNNYYPLCVVRCVKK